MDFMIRLVKLQWLNTSMYVIVCQHTKSTHSVPIKITYWSNKPIGLYVWEIVKTTWSCSNDNFLPRCKIHFQILTNYNEEIGTHLNFSTIFHPQTEDKLVQTIRTLENMLTVIVSNQAHSWKRVLPLIKFTYNNNSQAMIEMTCAKP